MVELAIFGAIGAIVAALLFWQSQKKHRLRQARVVEAPVPARGTIVSALLVGLAVMSGLFALLLVSVEEWSKAAVPAAAALAFALGLWFTRKPLGVLRIDAEERVLTSIFRGAAVRLDLRQPFGLTERLWIPRRSCPAGSAETASPWSRLRRASWW